MEIFIVNNIDKDLNILSYKKFVDKSYYNKEFSNPEQIIAHMLEYYLLRKKHHIQDTILFNKYGKPLINNKTHYSLSHSLGCCAIAISNCEIGIDIEKARKLNKLFKYRFFTKNELQQIDISKNPKIKEIEIWTRKEALYKMLGTGLVFPLDRDVYSDYDYQIKTFAIKNMIVSVSSYDCRIDKFKIFDSKEFLLNLNYKLDL